MTGQHHCSWTDIWVLGEVVRRLQHHSGCTHLGGLVVWPWAYCPVTPWLGASLVAAHLLIHTLSPGLGALASLKQHGSGRSSRPAMAAQSSVCPGSTAATRRERRLAEVTLLVVPELTKVGSGLSLLCCSLRGGCSVPFGLFGVPDSKISWGRDNLYKMLVQCLAQWSSNLSWVYRHNPNLNNISLDYEFIGVCESVLSRDGFIFPLTCLLSRGWEGSKGSSQWSLISDHRTSSAPSPIPCKIT